MNKFLFGNKNNRQIWIIFIVANLLYSLMIFMSIPHFAKTFARLTYIGY